MLGRCHMLRSCHYAAARHSDHVPTSLVSLTKPLFLPSRLITATTTSHGYNHQTSNSTSPAPFFNSNSYTQTMLEQPNIFSNHCLPTSPFYLQPSCIS
ncbi:hypothetical protein DCAR_0729777 [Daucus carota subsp. sativus]|uniref:Uncharacterized protein n=1 Tax=Daucus carota subsp. sativus TaxID=79200 RepID=A0A164UG79_DAUCS|nr:hypothetical protein DCAR_0729777 [Daucus carota subsp. sativus]